MNANLKPAGPKKPRINLTKRDIDHLYEVNGTESVAGLANRTGLPYLLIYNIVRRRVRSVSPRHYTMLFGNPAPAQVPLKVDGRAFRAMAELWLFINDGSTRAELYRELVGLESHQRVDHRIFSGKINTVDQRLEHAMRQKFLEAGIDEPLLGQWLDEFEALPSAHRVPYAAIRPTLDYLKEKLGLHPTSVLNQSVSRYESGMLRSVPRHVAERAEALKQAAEKTRHASGSGDAVKARETILGGKMGYTLYADIREELQFVIKSGGRGAKFFLGRSLWTYEHGRARHIADWRAKKILGACDQIIRQAPTLALSAVPPSRRRRFVRWLIDVLMARTSRLLSRKDGIDLEKQILRPSHRRDEYGNPYHGFTPFEMASRVLGMRRRAFDLMVTENCEIFRSVGRFSRRWYLSDLYLRELSGKKDFKLILAKYEMMAKTPRRRQPAATCPIGARPERADGKRFTRHGHASTASRSRSGHRDPTEIR